MAQVDYKAILDEAWQQHLAEREPDAPTLISLFAGCGGSSLGYSMAGYRELLAVEWNDNAVATFKLNFPDVPVYHGDIHNLSVEQCLEMTGLQPGELDLLDGSPPCQGFSTAGKRQINDKRNQLYMEYVRLLRGLRPKVFVMENVSGLIKGKMKLVFADIMKELKASGYRVRCKLLNAMWFQVPQSRERLIWIGVRDDLDVKIGYPKAQYSLISLRTAIENADATGTPSFNDVYAQIWHRVKIPRGKRMTSSAYDILKKGFNSCVKSNPDLPCCTLPKTQTGHGFGTITHWTEPRALSIGEAKCIQSIPNVIQLTGTYSMQWECIGNSVPPLFMRAIAQHIRQEMLEPRRVE